MGLGVVIRRDRGILGWKVLFECFLLLKTVKPVANDILI